MRQLNSTIALAGLLVCASVSAQQPGQPASAEPHVPTAKPARVSRFLSGSPLDASLLVPRPPADDSATTRQELKELHALEKSRTSQEIKAAKADDEEEDIFVYRTIFGSSFTPENLPLLAALSTDVHNEEPVASAPLKSRFARPRPYQLDPTLHPVCKTTTEHNSYPSGHTISGYLLAYTMAYIAPDKKEQILQRTEEYAHNRLVCGVHYASDLVASREVASAVFGAMLTNPMFRKRVEAARQELQQRLNVSASR